MGEITLNTSRSFGEIYGVVAGFPGAQFEQDGYYFNARKKLMDGQDYVGIQAPAANSDARALPSTQVIGRGQDVELAENITPELRQLDQWMNDLKGNHGRAELMKYAKEVLEFPLPANTKLVEGKALVRVIFATKAKMAPAKAEPATYYLGGHAGEDEKGEEHIPVDTLGDANETTALTE